MGRTKYATRMVTQCGKSGGQCSVCLLGQLRSELAVHFCSSLLKYTSENSLPIQVWLGVCSGCIDNHVTRRELTPP
jgi:hypothetical protein